MRSAAVARIDVHLGPDDLSRALREDARRGLTSTPKELPPKYFYDERGSLLFDEITRLPEYYPTRREREILLAHADDIARLSDAHTLVELGSGTSEKTRILLDALCGRDCLRRFAPFDVSEAILRQAADAINDEYAHLEVHAVVGDFERHIPALPNTEQRLIAFLGGTIGNFAPEPRGAFLSTLAQNMHEGDVLLIGFDLVKDIARLEAAYNDSRGVTADFNRNVLRVLNRELGANFVPERFAHVAVWNEADSWIEMRLRSTVEQAVDVPGLGLHVSFAAGEEMRTEISAKFTRERVVRELAAAGLDLAAWWTDGANDFGLALAERQDAPRRRSLEA
jgi:L-histidine N-alpha-methyltransferase